MDRIEDEMMRQWEEVSKEEEKVTLRKNEGRQIQKRKEHNMCLNKRCHKRR